MLPLYGKKALFLFQIIPPLVLGHNKEMDVRSKDISKKVLE